MPNDIDIFLCAYWPLVYLFWRNVHSDPVFILKLGCLFIIELYKFCIYYGWISYIRYMLCKTFLLFGGFSFHFLNNVL